MQSYKTNSDSQTKTLAGTILKIYPKGRIFALTGELGSGKTTFVQGIAKSLGIKDSIISPTFVLIRQHKIPKTKKILFHVDLYRLEKEADFKNLGLEDILNDLNHFIAIEWAEKAKNILPKKVIIVKFKTIDTETREIKIYSSIDKEVSKSASV